MQLDPDEHRALQAWRGMAGDLASRRALAEIKQFVPRVPGLVRNRVNTTALSSSELVALTAWRRVRSDVLSQSLPDSLALRAIDAGEKGSIAPIGHRQSFAPMFESSFNHSQKVLGQLENRCTGMLLGGMVGDVRGVTSEPPASYRTALAFFVTESVIRSHTALRRTGNAGVVAQLSAGKQRFEELVGRVVVDVAPNALRGWLAADQRLLDATDWRDAGTLFDGSALLLAAAPLVFLCSDDSAGSVAESVLPVVGALSESPEFLWAAVAFAALLRHRPFEPIWALAATRAQAELQQLPEHQPAAGALETAIRLTSAAPVEAASKAALANEYFDDAGPVAALAVALFAVSSSESWEEAISVAAAWRHDGRSAAALCGALKGWSDGASGVPRGWFPSGLSAVAVQLGHDLAAEFGRLPNDDADWHRRYPTGYDLVDVSTLDPDRPDPEMPDSSERQETVQQRGANQPQEAAPAQPQAAPTPPQSPPDARQRMSAAVNGKIAKLLTRDERAVLETRGRSGITTDYEWRNGERVMRYWDTQRVRRVFGRSSDEFCQELRYDKTIKDVSLFYGIGMHFPFAVLESALADMVVHGRLSSSTQMTLFCLDAVVRTETWLRQTKRLIPRAIGLLGLLRWLHTQGIPWNRAVTAGILEEVPEPTGWLIKVPELFEHRDPDPVCVEALSAFAERDVTGWFSKPINRARTPSAVPRAIALSAWSDIPERVFEQAAANALLTHGHPDAYLSAGAYAVLVNTVLSGGTLADGIEVVADELAKWPDENVRRLLESCELTGPPPSPSELSKLVEDGAAPNALAVAVMAAARDNDFESAVRRAAEVLPAAAPLVGGFHGARNGEQGLPRKWLDRLELRDVVDRLAFDVAAVQVGLPERVWTPDWAGPYPGF